MKLLNAKVKRQRAKDKRQFLKSKFCKLHFAFCILLFVLGSTKNLYSQSYRDIHVGAYPYCNQKEIDKSNLDDLEFEYYLDNQKANATISSFPVGSHTFRVVAKRKAGFENSPNPFIIKEIRCEDNNIYSKNPQVITPNNTDATITLNILPPTYGNETSFLNIIIEKCGSATQNLSHIKIATRVSCLDGGNGEVNIQEGVTVNIGGNSYKSNANGVIEADLAPGTYPVTAQWKDYPLGFVNQNGLRQKPNEGGNIIISIKDKVETLEIRMLTCAPTGEAKARAIITDIGNSVFLTRKNVKSQVFVGMQLRDGDLVQIKGTAKLNWYQGNGIVSFEDPNGNAIFVVSPDYTPTGNKPYTGATGPSNMEIIRGVGSFFFPRGEVEQEGKFKASTHTIITSVKGTKFSVGYDDQTQISTVVVTEGVVIIYPKNESLNTFNLYAGQKVEVSLTQVGAITSNSGNIITSNGGNTTGQTNASPPAWSRGEQLLPISYETAMQRADAALRAEGYVNIFTQANIKAGYKGNNSAVIISNDAPNGKQWINIVVTSITSDAGVPGYERERLQAQMNNAGGYVPPQTPPSQNIDFSKTAEEFRGKIGQRFTFLCAKVDYIGHRLYGTDIYTDDSCICTAGVHAGVIPYSGGMVTIEIRGAQNSFQGSNRNGANSSSWGVWPGSFVIVR